MNRIEEAINTLKERDYLSYIDIIEPLRLNNAKLLHFSEKGIVIDDGHTTFIAPFTDYDFAELYEAIPESSTLVSVHSDELTEYLEDKGFSCDTPCALYVYDKNDIEVDDVGILAPLNLSHRELILEHYHLVSDEGYISYKLQEGSILGLFVDNELVGFISRHAEGAMGMLEIFPNYRRKGYGAAAEKMLIKKILEKGEVPYANVVNGNTPSIKLQEILGLTKAEKVSNWLSRNE